MIGWKQMVGKKVYIEVKRGRHPYQGIVTEVDEKFAPHLVFISIKDIYGNAVVFSQAEIALMKEEL